MRRIAPLAAVALIAAIATPIVVAQGGSAPGAPDKTRVTAGTYAADPGHTMVVWEVDHLGFSKYTGLFGDVTGTRSEEHTSELQSLMRISYAVFCLQKKKNN